MEVVGVFPRPPNRGEMFTSAATPLDSALQQWAGQDVAARGGESFLKGRTHVGIEQDTEADRRE